MLQFENWNPIENLLLAMLKTTNIKQLLDEVEHDILNYQNRGLYDMRF